VSPQARGYGNYSISKKSCAQETVAVFCAVSSRKYREGMLKVAFEGLEVRLPHLCNDHMASVSLGCPVGFSLFSFLKG